MYSEGWDIPTANCLYTGDPKKPVVYIQSLRATRPIVEDPTQSLKTPTYSGKELRKFSLLPAAYSVQVISNFLQRYPLTFTKLFQKHL